MEATGPRSINHQFIRHQPMLPQLDTKGPYSLDSFPMQQFSQCMHARASHLSPTLSPKLTGLSTVPSPMATTVPTPSCPPTRGNVGLRSQSPLRT